MIREFYGNGKLLLSGEYLILDGGYGLAIPTKYGQYLRVAKNDSAKISWKSLDEKGTVWFEGVFRPTPLKAISGSDKGTSETLLKILSEAQHLNPGFLKGPTGYDIETELTFPRNWGLGSSSTLINNIANWANVNAHDLLKATFGGSGYDISCARHNKPILYHIDQGLPIAQELDWEPPFIDSLYFIHLNKKQNSREAISAYRKQKFDKKKLTHQINQLTKKLITSAKIEDFEYLLERHEELLSEALGMGTIKSKLFPDYPGVVKSLGAWGGDFILATGNSNSPEYFKEKGYDIVIPFAQMIL